MKKKVNLILGCIIFISIGCASNPYYEEAKYQLADKKWDAALGQLRLAVAQEPLRTEVRNKYADVLAIKKNQIGALVQYVAVLKIDPKNVYAKQAIKKFVNKGLKNLKTLIKEKKGHEAYNSLDNLIEVDRGNDEIYRLIGKIKDLLIIEGNEYFEKDDFVRAAAVYKNALLLETFEADKKSNSEKSLLEKFKIIKDKYKNKAKKVEIADTYAAIGDYEKALSVDLSNSRLFFKIGKLYGFFTEFHHEAYLSFMNAIANDPKVSKFHLHLGELYYIKGDFKSAEREIMQGLKLLEKEVAQNVYNKKEYKYFYDSIDPFKRMIKGITGKKKDIEEGLYIPLKKDKKIPVSLSEKNKKNLEKALKISKKWGDILSTVRTSTLNEEEKFEIATFIHSLHDLIRQDSEEIKKEKEVFQSILTKFENIGPDAVTELKKFGSIIEIL